MRPTNLASNFPRNRFQQTADRSQGVVEFALALPILLMLLFGIIDFSLLFSAWLLIQNMSRQAVRYAVTGEYNPAYCTAGCTANADEDQARLRSIHDQAEKYLSGLLVDQSAILQSDPGYLVVTVCSAGSPPDFQSIIGVMGSTIKYSKCKRLSDGAFVEDPGGPGDAVIVMIDFNHPYLTPFINKIWPMVHLVSAQQGIIEKFRVSRALPSPVGVYLGSPTPSDTFTITPSPTSTDTFTPSPTASNTFTPSPTDTPTVTATPDCSLFSFTSGVVTLTNHGSSHPRVSITILNSSPLDTYIQNLVFDWAVYDATVPTQSINLISYGGATLSSITQASSPATWVLVGPPDSTETLGSGSAVTFNFDYKNADLAWPGDAYANTFGISVHLGNSCDVDNRGTGCSNRHAHQHSVDHLDSFQYLHAFENPDGHKYPDDHTNTPSITPTPTKTNTPSMTFTPSNTVPTSTRTATRTRTPTRTATNTVPSNTPTRTLHPDQHGAEQYPHAHQYTYEHRPDEHQYSHQYTHQHGADQYTHTHEYTHQYCPNQYSNADLYADQYRPIEYPHVNQYKDADTFQDAHAYPIADDHACHTHSDTYTDRADRYTYGYILSVVLRPY